MRLKWGDHVLSEADSWYVPARLKPDMNHALEISDTPFGKVIAELHSQRRTLSARPFWSPLPDGREMGATPTEAQTGALAIPGYVLEHRAVLPLPGSEPISEVIETYTGKVLAFPFPDSR